MNKKLIAILFASLPAALVAQNAFDAFTLSQTDLRGTARFMSMGGAFTALGGDMSSLHQNPAGIGVYRSNDINATLQIDFQSAKTAMGDTYNQTKANCNNIGYVGVINLGESQAMPFVNYGFSYARTASFNRSYAGRLGTIGTSLTNLVADYTSFDAVKPIDMIGDKSYSPWWDGSAPWMSTMLYNGYGINPYDDSSTDYQGLYDYNQSQAQGWFNIFERGYVDDYSIDFGGNVMNTVYWGLGIGITDLDYHQEAYYSESIQDARLVALDNNGHTTSGYASGNADFDLTNYNHTYGTGFNAKFGVIVRPIDEFRIGFAVHTPTYYDLTTETLGQFAYDYRSSQYPGTQRLTGRVETADGELDVYDWKMRTPWRLMFGAAGIIGGQGIISIDYEYRPTQDIFTKDNNGFAYNDINDDINTYYKAVNIIRLGAEYRVSPHVSLRAGYAYESSPVTQQAMDNDCYYFTSGPGDAGTQPSVTMNRSTQYVTAGLGYKYQGFYFDLAYVHKYRRAVYRPFTSYHENMPDVDGKTYDIFAPSMLLTRNDNSLVMTMGFRF